MRRWLRISISPVFWVAATQAAWTVILVLWIVYFLDRRARLPQEGYGVFLAGMILMGLMMVGVTVIVVHFGRQVAHNRAVKDFVSQVSHDLRSPLATVKLHLETIRLRDLEKAQRAACLDVALTELARLESGIEAVLTASRIERSALRVSAEDLGLDHWLAAYAQAKSAEVSLQGAVLEPPAEPPPALTVRADPVLLRQMMDNLVDNAVRHGPPGVHVRLELGEQGRCAVLGVRDNGPGLHPDEHKRVFRMFYRAPSPGRPTRGTGLGLFIVAGIAHAHGGDAWVESAGTGHGCCFRVAVPLPGKLEVRP
jgi:signal transduction histidine kinase